MTSSHRAQTILKGDKEHEDDDGGYRGRPREHGTVREQAVDDIRMLRDFCDGMEYRSQFDDHRIFQTMGREGAVFIRFVRNCLSRQNIGWTRWGGQHHRHGRGAWWVRCSIQQDYHVAISSTVDQSHDRINEVPFWTTWLFATLCSRHLKIIVHPDFHHVPPRTPFFIHTYIYYSLYHTYLILYSIFIYFHHYILYSISIVSPRS